LYDQLQPFDLCLRLGEGGALCRKRAHHPPQRLYVVWQGGKVDVHDGKSLADSRSSPSISMRD